MNDTNDIEIKICDLNENLFFIVVFTKLIVRNNRYNNLFIIFNALSTKD